MKWGHNPLRQRLRPICGADPGPSGAGTFTDVHDRRPVQVKQGGTAGRVQVGGQLDRAAATGVLSDLTWALRSDVGAEGLEPTTSAV